MDGMEKTARLDDLAKAAGVSKGTASNVFNRPELVREEVREHVRAVAKAIGYRGPDPRGRLLRAGKVNAIGVATDGPLSYFFDDPFARVLMSGVTEICDAQGAGISLVSAEREAELTWNIQNALVDGFILFCMEGSDRLIELSRDRQLPFVALSLLDDPKVPGIGVDNVLGGRLAAEHLVALGHRRFAVLTMAMHNNGAAGRRTEAEVRASIYSGTRDRLEGSFAVLREAAIDTGTVPIFETEENDDSSVIPALEALFAGTEPPTAIIAQSDRIALAAIAWLDEKGISVPGDVSITGFDGVPEAASAGLTTIAQPIAEIGRRAARHILNHEGSQDRQMLDIKLVVQGSTAAPKA